MKFVNFFPEELFVQNKRFKEIVCCLLCIARVISWEYRVFIHKGSLLPYYYFFRKQKVFCFYCNVLLNVFSSSCKWNILLVVIKSFKWGNNRQAQECMIYENELLYCNEWDSWTFINGDQPLLKKHFSIYSKRRVWQTDLLFFQLP